VGRIAASSIGCTTRSMTRRSAPGGFSECLPDPEAAGALFAAAEDWLRQRGMESVRVPSILR